MFNKKIMMWTIILVSLLAVSAVSAADNATSDVVSVKDDVGEFVNVNDARLDENVSYNDLNENYGSLSSFDEITDDVENDYMGMYVESGTGYYNGKNKINYGWEGNFEGYFRIYNADDLIYEKQLNTMGSGYDGLEYVGYDYTYDGSKINAVGTYDALITDVNGNQLAVGTLKVTKAPTHAKCDSFMAGIGARETVSAKILDESNSGKNIGGTAKFNINGKTYKVKVKNGIATLKRVKLPLKAKTYKCKVTFSGDKNYKGSSANFKIKLSKTDAVILKKDKKIKVGKYVIKLTSNQYRALVKAFNKDKSKSFKVKTGYKYDVKVPYTKTVKKYKTTKAVKTLYSGSYLPMINEMKNAGWKKVSEYTYTKANPQNQQGIGLSAYTYAVCKWVKTSYKTAYKTKSYPVYAKVIFKKGDAMPGIEIYYNGNYLDYRYIAIA